MMSLVYHNTGGRLFDPAQPMFEVRVVHVGMPAVQAQCVPILGVDDNFVVWHGGEDIQDIVYVAVADFNPQSVYKDQPVDAMLACDGNFSC